MDLVALGTVALDSVESPAGRVDDALGGSSTYFSLASRFFVECGIISVVGMDFPTEHLGMLQAHGVDTQGVEIADGKSFRWSGRYEGAMNEDFGLVTYGYSWTPSDFTATGVPVYRAEAIEFLLARIARTETNAEFLDSMAQGV